jgi:hypothetical protein
MANLSGTVMLRPARVGFVTSGATMDEVVRAAQLATTSWGGKHYPIIDLRLESDFRPKLERWSIDVLWSLSEDEQATALAAEPGFRWAGRSPWGPFDAPRDSLSTRLLGSEWPLGPHLANLVLPQWSEDDALAAYYSVVFGRFADDQDGENRAAKFSAVSDAVVIRDKLPVAELVEAVTPIEVTGQDIEYLGDSPGEGVVLVDPSSVADLILFWNLRASGARVIAWPVGHDEVVADYARAWLRTMRDADRLLRWRAANGAQLPPQIEVWSADAATEVTLLKEITADLGIGTVRSNDYHLGTWRGQHPLRTEFIRSFDVEIPTRAAVAQVPLPVLPWPRGRRGGMWPGVVAADISIYSHGGLGIERTSAVPRVRRLATLMEGSLAERESFQRPNADGGIYGTQASSESISVAVVHSLDVMQSLFDRADWQFSQSDEGHFAGRLTELLGGARTNAANQPAMRELLLRAAKRSDVAMPFAALMQAGLDARGEWPNFLDQRPPEAYVKTAILWLLERKLLRIALPVECPACRSKLVLGPEEITTDVNCGFCDFRFPIGASIAWAGRRSDWRYRIAGHVAEPRLLGALPVLAANSVLSSLVRGGYSHQAQALGVEVRVGKKSREFDIMTVADPERPEVVLGEVKSHLPIDQNDLDNLRWAQEHLRRQGVECYILVATLNPASHPDEVRMLRMYCEESIELLHSDGSQTPLALPIVLARGELSVGQFSDGHPFKWTEPGKGLSPVALESCRRNLGLVEVLSERSETGWTYRFIWTEEPAIRG